MSLVRNPYRPGAGHQPPYLAGRLQEKLEFDRLFDQDVIIENAVLTGLRGLGKTVLLDDLKSQAITKGWLWTSNDLTETTTISEENLAIRLMTDISVLTSRLVVDRKIVQNLGFASGETVVDTYLDFNFLRSIYSQAPGLDSDKLRHVLDTVWLVLNGVSGFKGIVFAYDEAQNIADHAEKDQYPLSLLLDTFQYLQKKGVRFMLILTGLPTLFPKLVESRTFSERMFRVITLGPLSNSEVQDAITKPLEDDDLCLSDDSIKLVTEMSGGYPYFVQFICREVYDLFAVKIQQGQLPAIPTDAIIQKLDTDFFSGRWARATDRQRELLTIIATIEKVDAEFTVQDIVNQSRDSPFDRFKSSNVNQMLSALSNAGLVYKNRHGKYSFAVPLFDEFILRQ